jgi:hypothetical protein
LLIGGDNNQYTKFQTTFDLENKNIVEEWWVKYNILHISYIDEENYIKYTGVKPKDGDTTQYIKADNEFAEDYKFPEDEEIMDAEDYSVNYSEDEEDEDKNEN